MKICYITTVPITLEAFMLPIIRYIHEQTDWEIYLICDEDPDFRSRLPEYIRYLGVPMKRGIRPGGIRAAWKMFRIFRSEKFDLIQYSTPNAALYASVAAYLAGVKCRKYHLMGFRYLGFRGMKKWLFKVIEKITCTLSTDVECVSQSNLRLGVSEKIFSEKKASVLFYGSTSGVDMTRFDIAKKQVWRDELRRKYGYEENHCVFGFAGRITGDKGIDELFSAFRQMDHTSARLFLVGEVEDKMSLSQPMLTWAQDSDMVTFQGFVDDVERYFAMMDVLVLPSHREGFGNIVIEAQAMGVPVIVTDIPGPTDAMQENETGLIVPLRDVTALKAAMETLAADVSMRQSMGNKGHRFVAECFDQRKLCEAILNDRRELLGKSTGTH